MATTEKSTMGYFHDFNWHLVVNDKREILNFMISQGHIDDREPLKDQSFIKSLKGKIFADKDYMFITSSRNTMKNNQTSSPEQK